jgi:beta-fructofuranosidase
MPAMQVIFEGVDPATQQPTTLAVGGALTAPQPCPDTLHLRVLLDHSVLEVFTAGGEVLTTRVYRGSPPPEQQQDAGIDFVAYGGAAAIARLEAHEMGSMWKEDAVAAGQALSRAGSGLHISRL